MSKLKKGFVQIYTGNGKGKTSAALGLAFRAAGHNLKTTIIQFMKGKINYGELNSARKFPGLIRIIQCGRAEFVDRKNPSPVDINFAQKAIRLAEEELKKKQADILVLDEICCALDYNLISFNQIKKLIKNKPAQMELILTGRCKNKNLYKYADLVTEMKEVKHYWKNKVSGRKGIEF